MVKSKITDNQKDEVINDYFKNKGFQVGIKKLYLLLREKEPDYKISYRYVANWLKNQSVYQINQLQFKTPHIRPIRAKRKFGLVQFDLIDYSQNTAPNSYKYLLTIIDVYSRYAWAIPIKNKTKLTLVKVFTEWLSENKDEEYPYTVFMSDQGGEWADLQSIFDKYNIKYTRSTVPQSQGIIERLNQTLRRMLAKNIIIKDVSTRWGLVPTVVKNYNETYHSTIKMTPIDKFNLKNKKMINKLDKQQQKDDIKLIDKRVNNNPIINSNEELDIGDWVRVKRLKKSALSKTKGFLNWSDAIYTVIKRVRALKATTQPRYQIQTLEGDIVKKYFYRNDLLKISTKTLDDNKAIGKPNDNPNDITEEEILFEVKKEDNDNDVEIEKK